jgi:3-isopropylmalate/(R)-2-methylmalate dehydratase small subunit
VAPLTRIVARAVPLPKSDVDTDQIIPARFLKVVDKRGLGRHLFADWRYDAEGRALPDFPLNRPEYGGAEVLLAGDNFGCGSSREHAPWALVDFGFRAVVSTSFADIFHANALKNGLLPVAVDEATHRALLARVEADPATAVTIDLEAQRIEAPGIPPAGFPIDGFSKHCLLYGVDELGYLLALEDRIAAFEERREGTKR